MDNKTVYVVVSGEHSDFQVGCLFSAREKAEFWISEKNKDKSCWRNDHRVIEWKLDEEEGYILREFYTVVINAKTGEIVHKNVGYDMANPQLRSRNNDWYTDEFLKDKHILQLQGQSYVSFEHAEKLAVELRQKYLRIQGTNP